VVTVQEVVHVSNIGIKFKNIGLIIVLLTFLIFPTVRSISLSTIQKNKYSNVRIGESTEFIILFWNPEESSLPIELRLKQISNDLSVIIVPKSFIIEPSLVTKFPAKPGKEYVDTPGGLMEATPVRVIIKPSDNADLGRHDIYVGAIAGSPREGVSTFLEKTLKFSVNVTSPPTIFERLGEITGRIAEATEDVTSRITGMAPAGSVIDLTLLVVSVIVLAFVVWFTRFR
jgi:hypothetical protein